MADNASSQRVGKGFVYGISPHCSGLPDAEKLFVFNRSGRPIAGDFSFCTHGCRPEWWDAVTDRRGTAAHRVEGGRIVVPLEMATGGSSNVVLRQKGEPAKPERRR
ncbi:hypothetical protein [Croceicoccus sp. YJ47]|uniref:hypothetical protein n=1 Tax=Croceicoccus sp. YJ47 TaxID=2798724 RepID=UPI001F332367|nr:hypothetical protein [Croceicoccus sp. YJ47]